MHKTLRPSLSSLALSASGLCLASCGGGGGGGGDFQLMAITVPQGAAWEINRPIEFEFSQPVDFSSVNSNSITIRTPQGVSALGDFSLKSTATGVLNNVVVFQPRCPLNPDFSDAGLIPNGQAYRIEVIGSDVSIGLSVRSADDVVLDLSQQRDFTTKLGTEPSQVFLDTKLGPPAVVLRNAGTEVVEATHLRLIGSGERRYFEINALAPGGVLVEPFDETEPDYPINLYSDVDEQFDLVVVFDQPVAPDAVNLSSDRIQLQSRPIGSAPSDPWVARPSEVVLEANCTSVGARVRLRPIGVLPQQHEYRAVVAADFTDIVGEQGLLPQANFAPFETREVDTAPFGDGVLADEFFESFNVGGDVAGSFEQTEATFPEPAASWGDGRLTATFEFIGTGGPQGTFDWQVPAGTFVLSTDTSSLNGGPGFTNTTTQTVVNGVVNVNNLRVPFGSTLRAVGPNPLRIFVTGKAEIFGTIDVSGLSSQPVAQLNSPNIPQPGAAGVAGGGRGGRGSPLTTTSSPKGENGIGAFNLPSGGGVGGESGFRQTATDELRRGAGGGGGRFASDFPSGANAALNAELGGTGALMAKGAVADPGGGFSAPPLPGDSGPSSFVDTLPNGQLNGTNDFWGTLFDPGLDPLDDADDSFVAGELPDPRAGTGGGGGGDNINSAQFPPATFDLGEEKKGGGGGGGAGQLQIFALGDIVFGVGGRIVCNGGRGGEGESTAGTNQVGGGGAGGSGGHVILQTTGRLDLSANPPAGSIQAIGGEGANGQNDGDNEPPPAALSSGGDGGAGVIQIHLESFALFDPMEGTGNVILPTGQTNVVTSLNSLTSPDAWRLFPSFGSSSRARSEPIPLGSLGINTPLQASTFALEGIDPDDGSIDTAGGAIVPIDPLFVGPQSEVDVTLIDPVARVVEIALSAGAVSDLSTTGVEYCYDASGLVVPCDGGEASSELFADDVYLRNPQLLRQFQLVLTQGSVTRRLTVASAEVETFLDGSALVRLFLSSAEGTLVEFVDGSGEPDLDQFLLHPRYFRVVTGGQLDVLPVNQEIRLRVQALGALPDGTPDLVSPLVPWTPNVAEISSSNVVDAVQFLQFEVTFDLDKGGAGVSGNSPLPSLEFLRLPFRF
jgi:hypothetical protein